MPTLEIALPLEEQLPAQAGPESDRAVPATTPRRRIAPSKLLGRARDALLALAFPVVVLSVWEFLARRGSINPSILPSPTEIWSTFLDLMKTGELENHVRTSLLRVVEGFAVGATLGVLAGFAIGLSATVEKSLVLVTGLLRPIPIIAWVPVLILWVGIDEASKVTVIAIGSFWPVLLNSIHGIRGTDPKFLEVARILGKSKWTILSKVIFPSALPSIFTGLRIGVGIAWTSVIGAELIAASSGVGYLIMYARELSQPDVMLVGVFSIGIVGLTIDFLLRRIERRVLRWNLVHQGKERKP
jgi:sulfonate transport system permease protein